MPPSELVIKLLSDTTIASGMGTPGVVDTEVVYDNDTGLPYIPGKTLHGLLRETWLSMQEHFQSLRNDAVKLLGEEGDHSEVAILRVGNARLPEEIRLWADYAVHRGRDAHPLRPEVVLRTVTDVRQQTAQSRESGAPEEHTLRATRVLLRGLTFSAPLTWLEGNPVPQVVRCLALCALGTRHLGLARNRGRGFVRIILDGSLEETQRLAKMESTP